MTIDPQTLRRLMYFAAIAEAGSIRGAAASLRLSVPVVSAALADLEADLGVTLATRTTRSFRLTEAGQTVQACAARIAEAGAAALAVAAPDRPLSGRVSINLPVELASHWLPPRLAAFRSAHPGVDVSVTGTDRVLSGIENLHDLSVRTRRIPSGTRLPGGAIPLICLAPVGTEVRWDGTRGQAKLPLLTHAAEVTHLTGIRRADGASVALHFEAAITVDNRTVARAMAGAGLGAALLMDLERPDGLSPLAPDVDFGALTITPAFRDAYPAPAARALARML